MVRDKSLENNMTRRAFFLGISQAALSSVLLSRLYYLQIIERKKYLTLAEDNRISFRFLPPKRGLILDRFSEPLATNKKFFRLVLIPEGVQCLSSSIDKIKDIIKKPDKPWEEIIKESQKKPKFFPTVIKEDLTWYQVAKLEMMAVGIPGLYVEETWQRLYPYAGSTSHLMGYVGVPSDKAIKQQKYRNSFWKHPDARVGKSGLEITYNDDLMGLPGARHVEVNARGRIVRELKREKPIHGKNLVTTLDARLQEKILELLKPYKSGSVVVIDVQTGAVRAMVSTPTFDANAFTLGIDNATWKSLMEDEHQPLINKAIQGLYSPASTFKMVTALAGLQHDVVSPSISFFCPGYTKLGNHKYHCWKKGGHGTVDLKKAIAQSCDVYFYEIGKRLSIDQLAHTASLLGFGHKTGLDLPGEKDGLMPTRSWKTRIKKQPWVGGDTVNASIGQGYVLSTPVQLAVMMARLCSGKAIKPYFIEDNFRPADFLKGLDPKHLRLVLEGMNAVVNEQGGTGSRHKLPWPDWKMGGKTGTSQVRRITLEERRHGVIKNIHLPWKYRDHALFVGYAPVDKPKFALSIVVEHAGFGGAVAGPMANNIMKYLKENGI